MPAVAMNNRAARRGGSALREIVTLRVAATSASVAATTCNKTRGWEGSAASHS